MTNYRDEYKAIEQQWMVLKDEYSEIARALGFEGDRLWGDPMAKHDEIVERARRYRAQAVAVHLE